MDLSGTFEEIVFRIPAPLLLSLFKPKWFGQVDTAILFSLRSQMAFNCYLFAALTIIEKDKTKEEFWSEARPITEWAEVLGVRATAPYRFKQDVFKAIPKLIRKTTDKTDEPIEVEFTDAHCKRGLYQMRVKRLKKARLADRAKAEKKTVATEVAKQIAADRLKSAEQQKEMTAICQAWVAKHPERKKIELALSRKYPDDWQTDLNPLRLHRIDYPMDGAELL
jgi:hypothetical protein